MLRTILVVVVWNCAIVPAALAGDADLSFRLERQSVLTSSLDTIYFQSRAAIIPTSPPRIILTTQETERVGAHGYRDVFQIKSQDDGKTWSSPERIESLRRMKTAAGDEVVAGDLSPQWHAKTGVILATGKTFTFRGGTREDRSAEQVSYCVYSPRKKSWGEMRILAMPETDHAGRKIVAPNTGCCQRFDLPDGDILLPIRYCPEQGGKPYTTIVALCRFDGDKLAYVKHGTEFNLPSKRGLYEPSVAGFAGRYFLTMRADDSAYVARSSNGLDYEPMVAWKFDDGSPLGSYNTQQHWIVHSGGLFLCYTRRGANNDHIFRHRAPLFMARVDPERLCVLRDTEQVLLPADHVAFGNGGVTEISPTETWVVESEMLQGPRQKERNHVLVTRILWSQPNELFTATGSAER